MNNFTNTTRFGLDFLEHMKFVPPPPIFRTVVEVCGILLTLLSLFGNIMIIIVYRKDSNKKSSTSILFIALAVSDLLFSLFSCSHIIANIFEFSTDINMFAKHPLLNVITQTNGHISNWMITLITLEKCVCVMFPFSVKQLCTRRRAMVAVLIVSFITVGVNVTCYTVIFVDGRIFIIFIWIDLIGGFLVPFFIIIVGSVIIIASLCKGKLTELNNKRIRSVLRNLIAVNISFVLTMSPIRLLPFLFKRSQESNLYAYCLHSSLLLVASNYALNFMIYIVSGERFRNDAKEVFISCVGRYAKRNTRTHTHNDGGGIRQDT